MRPTVAGNRCSMGVSMPICDRPCRSFAICRGRSGGALDRPWLLKLAGKFGAQTHGPKLGQFTLSVLRGAEGPQVKELRRLATFLKEHLHPEVISLPNLDVHRHCAGILRQELGVPVICELTGETYSWMRWLSRTVVRGHRDHSPASRDVARFRRNEQLLRRSHDSPAYSWGLRRG